LTRWAGLDDVVVPLVGAPLAGGPSTPALAAAVSEAGAIGFLAAGYKTAAAVQTEVHELRALTARPIGLNLFYPVRDAVDPSALEAYAERLRSEESRYGVALGEPRWTDDDWTAKLEVAARERPEVVSFTFGCPEREIVEWLRGCGCRIWCTVTSGAEAKRATSARVDALVVQGAEAGGHQGSFHDHDQQPRPLLALIREVRSATALPLVGAGGIADGGDVSQVVAAGAVGAQVGSALLLSAEAGTSVPHRKALKGDMATRLTRAFTGRRARGIVNRFLHDHDAFAPRGYPQIHNLTAPVRAAAREIGDADGINLWAGSSYRRAQEAPASELVERLAREMRTAH
jgi:nitronate monooxygenase